MTGLCPITSTPRKPISCGIRRVRTDVSLARVRPPRLVGPKGTKMPLTTTRTHVLAFRLRRHHLAQRLSAGHMADAVAACGIWNSPPGSALMALAARVDGVSENLMSGALTGKALVEVLGPCLVPVLARPDDTAVFTVGSVSPDQDSLRVTIGPKASRQLAMDGIELGDALTRVADAARTELEGGARTRGDLSAALTARLPKAMSLWCKRCGSWHVHETLFRLPGGVGVYCIAPRSGREVSYILIEEWLGARVPRPGSPGALGAGRDLLRRFLRCYGPATPGQFADWTKTSLPDARRRFADLAGDLEDMCWNGATGSVLREDIEELRRSELPLGVRLLPPNDPYLRARDRETLVPEFARQKAFWPSAGMPGALLAAGEIVGTWRSQKIDGTLSMQVSPHCQLSAQVVALVEKEAQILAQLRGCRSAVIEFC